MKRILSILFCLALPLCLSAQIRNNKATRKSENESTNTRLETNAAKNADNNSTTSQSTIYNLASHDDSHDSGVSASGKKIVMSELSDDYVVETVVPFDTLFYLPHRFRRADEYSRFNAGLGN